MALEINTAIKSPGTFVVTPIGSIDGTGHALLQEKLDSVLKLNPDTIIFDLEKTEYINSMAIRVLVKTKNSLRQSGGKIAFINLQPQIKRVFDILGALPALKVFKNIQEFDDYLRDELEKMDPKH